MTVGSAVPVRLGESVAVPIVRDTDSDSVTVTDYAMVLGTIESDTDRPIEYYCHTDTHWHCQSIGGVDAMLEK